MICAIEGLDSSNYTHGCLGLDYVFKYGPLSKPFVLIHHLNILCYLLYCYLLYNLFLTESKLSTISVCRRQWLEPGFRFEKLGTYQFRSGLERDVKSQLVLTRSYYRFTPMKSKLLLIFTDSKQFKPTERSIQDFPVNSGTVQFLSNQQDMQGWHSPSPDPGFLNPD